LGPPLYGVSPGPPVDGPGIPMLLPAELATGGSCVGASHPATTKPASAIAATAILLIMMFVSEVGQLGRRY
jgi:hypothetical protein